MYFEGQTTPVSDPTTKGEELGATSQLSTRGKGINDLGILKLHNIDSCTTDVVFL
jgi:hypothetical protein